MRIVAVAAAVLSWGLAVALQGAVPSGIRGTVDQKLQGVGDYNQALEDAMNGVDRHAPAPPQAGALKEGWITRKSRDGKDVRLYFAYPEAATKDKPVGGLILLHEKYGLNEEMKERTRNLAGKGYYAVAVDLFYGKVPEGIEQVQQMSGDLTDAAAMTAMKTGLDLLQEESGNGIVNAKHVGAIGWELGSQQAILVSAADSRVKATAVFYGTMVTDASKLKTLQGPVLSIYGKDDKMPGVREVALWQDALKTAGKTDVTIYTIPGAGHQFATKSSGNTYDETKARDAFDKLNAWLDAKLGH